MGGGMVIVPALIWILAAYGMPTDIVPYVAVGTALATIILTSISSMTHTISVAVYAGDF